MRDGIARRRHHSSDPGPGAGLRVDNAVFFANVDHVKGRVSEAIRGAPGVEIGPDATDEPTDLTARAWWHALRDAAKAFHRKTLTDRAAGLTFYSVLSIFPGLIVVVALLGVVGSEGSIEGLLRIADQLGSSSAVDTLRGPIENIVNDSGTAAGTALVFGLVSALWTASGYVGAFLRVADVIYDVEEERPFYKLRPRQLLMTLALAIATAAIVIGLVNGPLATAIGEELGIADATLAVWSIVRWPMLFAVVVLVVALLYRLSPDARQAGWRPILAGSMTATVIWLAASAGFNYYTSHFGSYSDTYGSLAGGIVVMLWLWLTNVAVIFGAQVVAELERTANAAAGRASSGAAAPIEPDEGEGEQRVARE